MTERSLNLIINTIPELAWSTEPDGSVDFLNQRWLDYTGFTAEQALGWNWATALHPDDIGDLTEYWKTIMATVCRENTRQGSAVSMESIDGFYFARCP